MPLFSKVSQSIAKFRRRIERLLGDHRLHPSKISLLRAERTASEEFTQLWLYAEPAGYRFEVRRLYGPRGRVTHVCTLESSGHEQHEGAVRGKGNLAFDAHNK